MRSVNSFPSLFRIAAASLLLIAFVLGPYFLLGTFVEMRAGGLVSSDRLTVAWAGGALLALDIFLPVPSSVVATAMGAALGAWLGTLVNAFGLTLGCLLGLVAGRSGSPLARSLLGESLYPPFAAWVARYGLVAVLLCRAIPVLAEASILALGAARARTGPAIAAAAFADLCLGVLYAVAGAARGPEAAPAAPALAAAVGVPAAAALLAWLWIRSGRADTSTSP